MNSRWGWIILSGLLFLMVPGCGGCVPSPDTQDQTAKKKEEELKKKKKEKAKPNFELGDFNTLPNSQERLELGVKPGHWTLGVLEAKANNFDYRGQLITDLVTPDNAPVDLDQTPYQLRASRPVVLPKGQKRYFEIPLFSPIEVYLHHCSLQIVPREGGSPVITSRNPLRRLGAHQYHMVVLARNSLSYQYLESLDTIHPHTGYFGDDRLESNYRLVIPKVLNQVALPDHSLFWTSVAFVVWDDLPPEVLTADQRQAMIDWLHWGGQLLVSGPASLDTLRGSFLEPYLPVNGQESRTLNAEDLKNLESEWGASGFPLLVNGEWPARKLLPIPEKKPQVVLATPDGEPLVVEGSVGLGRVLVTAFRLAQRDLSNWAGMDGFVNGCLLRRPKRVFKEEQAEVVVSWAESGRPNFDSLANSSVRFFSRDELAPAGFIPQEQLKRLKAPTFDPNDPLQANLQADFPFNQPFGGMGVQSLVDLAPVAPSAGAWNDFSAVSILARNALIDASGIVVPDYRFVISTLLAYVVLLVPVNWIIFRALGRVEWAWAAAPVISVIFAALVVWLAQLDIGFARSQNELNVIEAQAGYSRAHVSRYIALYTSLGTTYDMRFTDPSAMALPFPTGHDVLSGQFRGRVEYRRVKEVDKEGDDAEVTQARLAGLEVSSNSTGMVHSEEMLELGGDIHLEELGENRFKLVNNTDWELQGAGIAGAGQGAWLGVVAPGAAVEFQLTSMPVSNKNESLEDPWDQHMEESPVLSKRKNAEGMNLREFYQMTRRTAPSQGLRLLAWLKEPLPGVFIEPFAPQRRQASFLLVHLRYPPPSAPQRDLSSRAEITKKMGREWISPERLLEQKETSDPGKSDPEKTSQPAETSKAPADVNKLPDKKAEG